MRRREFTALLGSAAAWPMAAKAQQPALPVVGYLGNGSRESSASNLAAVRQGLGEAGFIEGKNATIETRYSLNQYDLLPALLAELIARKAAVIVTGGAAPAVAAKASTSTVPIVFFMGEDPVSLGLVTSFNRPSGNVTGIALLGSAVLAKRLEQLHDLVPDVKVVAALINPKNPNAEISTKDAQDAAHKLGLKISILNASTAEELNPAFAQIAQSKAGALLIAPDAVFFVSANQIAVLAARYGIPASHEYRAFPDAGGLMSYGANLADGARLAGVYAGRILKGERPRDLPVTQPTKFDLVINMKTAKALGLTVPPTLLVAATEVIE